MLRLYAYILISVCCGTFALAAETTTEGLMEDELMDEFAFLEESAVVDGASNGQVFFKIVVPLAAPGLVAVGVLTFIMTWIEFFYALIFTRGDMMTAPVGVVSFLKYAGWEWEKITAAGVVIMLPVIIFSIFTHRYLISGLTSGAVKG